MIYEKPLHPIIYFVADKPSKKNTRPTTPLVGTKSYKTFVNWLADMRIDITRVRLYNQSDKPFDGSASRFLNEGIDFGNVKVIALGKAAMEYLNDTGVSEYYALPHPSGLNRQLNDKQKLKETLSACEAYIYGKTNA